MNDVVIFMVGLGVFAVVLTSAFIGLIASDYPDGSKIVISKDSTSLR